MNGKDRQMQHRYLKIKKRCKQGFTCQQEKDVNKDLHLFFFWRHLCYTCRSLQLILPGRPGLFKLAVATYRWVAKGLNRGREMFQEYY